MDGATLAARIKSDPGLQDVVFIMLSSIGDWREVKGMEGSSVDACLVKPVRQNRLVRTLVETWTKKRQPAAQTSAPALVALHHTVSEQFAPSDARVLVVEDNPVNQRVALRMLQRLGVRADVASSGVEALELLRSLPYDFVFMDCQMPEMDGYETTSHIRRMEGPNGGVTVIALTADAMLGCRERCLEAGMDGFLAKPVQLNDFANVLKERLVTQAS
jgi:two-component system sensor histidine kinase/response regulator